MNCPSCLIAVPEGAVICDNCNHILDTSFLGGDITNEDDVIRHDEEGATRIKGPPVEEATRIKAVPLEDATRIKAVPEPKKKAKAAPAPALYEEEDDESTAHGRARATLDDLAAPSAATTEALDDLVAEFRRLARSERLSALGAGVVLLSLALPWKGTLEDGSLIGIVAGGWLVGLLAGLVLAALFLRRHPSVRPWKERVLQGVAGASALAGVLCVVYMKTNLDHRMVRSAGRLLRENTVWPEFGVGLALAGAMVMLGGALKSWMDREILPE